MTITKKRKVSSNSGNILSFFSPTKQNNSLNPNKKRKTSPNSGFKDNKTYDICDDYCSSFKPLKFSELEKKYQQSSTKSSKLNSKNNKNKENEPDQWFLDLGQRDFDGIVCPDCEMAYNPGQADDEITHKKFHADFLYSKKMKIVYFKNWKKLNYIELPLSETYAIIVTENSEPSLKDKVSELKNMINEELGLVTPCDKPVNEKTFVVVRKGKAIGCAVAEEIEEAFPFIDCSDSSSSSSSSSSDVVQTETPVKVMCGISRVWIEKSERRNKIASELLDIIRENFFYGTTLEKTDISFSSPTSDGKKLFLNYMGNNDLLVYS